MNELRILTGRMKGAVLALDEGLLKIGPGLESALMLPSEEIGDSQLSIYTSVQLASSVHEANGAVLSVDGVSVSVSDSIVLDEPIKMGEIWLVIVEPSTSSEQILERLFPEQYVVAKSENLELDIVELPKSDQVSEEPPAIVSEKIGVFRKSGFNVFMILVVSLGAYNFAYSRKLDSSDQEKSAADIFKENLESERISMQLVKEQENERERIALKNKKRIDTKKMTVEKMLEERELKGLAVSIESNDIILRGNLTYTDHQMLTRMVMRLEVADPNISLRNETTHVVDEFPLVIVSVAYGGVSKLVLEDHGVVSVGQTILGYRLDAITENKIYFSGMQQSEISW